MRLRASHLRSWRAWRLAFAHSVGLRSPVPCAISAPERPRGFTGAWNQPIARSAISVSLHVWGRGSLRRFTSVGRGPRTTRPRFDIGGVDPSGPFDGYVWWFRVPLRQGNTMSGGCPPTFVGADSER